MLAPVQRKYEVRIGNIRDSQPRSIIVYADTVSTAMELFLQDYLKNNRITVEVLEQTRSTRKV
jgi:hypothetical protein